MDSLTALVVLRLREPDHDCQPDSSDVVRWQGSRTSLQHREEGFQRGLTPHAPARPMNLASLSLIKVRNGDWCAVDEHDRRAF